MGYNKSPMTGHPPDHITQFIQLPLDPKVLDALLEMGYETMTEIQQASIPILLDGYDFLGQAPTGTGKTAAFGVPLVNKIQPGSGHTQALIIGPTRELVQQITEELAEIACKKGVKVMAVFGGESTFIQKEKLREGTPDIIVGTPGRLIDFLEQSVLNFAHTRMVILDEADEMLDMGFRDDIEKILNQTPRGRQTCLFSATVSHEIRQIADRFMMYPQEVRIQRKEDNKAIIDQYYFVLNEADKARHLKKMLADDPDFYGIVFCQTKKEVADLTRALRGRDYTETAVVEGIHSALPQYMRDDILDNFRERKFKMLVATDVLARGIDIDKLTHIINAQPPGDPESYIHRIGRTARAGESGVAITMFTPDQLEEYQRLERRVGMPMQKHPDCQMDFDPNARPASSGNRRGGYGRSKSGGGKNQPRNKARRHPSGGGGGGGRGRSRGGGGGGNRGGGGGGSR